MTAELGRQLAVPVVQLFHTMGKTKARHQGAADTSPHERIAVDLDLGRGVDRMLVVCPGERVELIDDYGADPAKVVVIPSAVYVEVFHPIARYEARRYTGLDTRSPVVVYVGRMLPRKDVHNVVRAVTLLGHQTRLPVKLLLVGGETVEPDPDATPEVGMLQALTHELG